MNAAGAVDFQIHIQHTSFAARKAQPSATFSDRNRQLHEQKGLTCLRGAGDQHLVSAPQDAFDQLLRELWLVCQQDIQLFQLRKVELYALHEIHPIHP